MKKLLSILAIGLFFALTPGAFAQSIDVYFDQSDDYTFPRNDFSHVVGPIRIIDQNGTSIKQQYGLRMIIPETLNTLWDKDSAVVTAQGSAVTAGKIDASVTPVYSQNLKEVFIPVKGDFARGEEVSFNGFRMKSYRLANDRRYLMLDVNNDKVGDIQNFRSMQVSSTEIRTDLNPPAQVESATATYANGQITLSWVNPPDLDLTEIGIERDGKQPQAVPFPEHKFVDTAVTEGETITYRIKTRDGNLNEGTPLSITVKAAVVAEVVTPTPAVVTPTVTDDELQAIPPLVLLTPAQKRRDALAMLAAMVQKKTARKGYALQIGMKRSMSYTFALQIALALTPDACGNSERFRGISFCKAEALKRRLVPEGTNFLNKITRGEFYALIAVELAADAGDPNGLITKQEALLVAYKALVLQE